ncbi:MAG: GDSL-type esterase/lipase family protein [Mariniblastus sp.]|nr:GDSL-type esterase/lipase family protein [Mariniblastus sp.]
MLLRLSLFLFIGLWPSFEVVWGQEISDAPTDQRFIIPETNEGLPGKGPIRRYDWFRKLWQQRRSEWAQQLDKDQGAIVFLGDSITQGWGSDMGGAFGKAKVANRGISGDTTRGMLIRLKEDVFSVAPSGVVLLMGTNDLEEQATPEVIAHNFKLILDALRNFNPDLPIIVCEVFPSSASKRRSASDIQKINALYQDAVKGMDHVWLIETYRLFADPNGDAKKEEFPDLLHPNKAGYEKWAKALSEPIKSISSTFNSRSLLKPTNQLSTWKLELTKDGKGELLVSGDSLELKTIQVGEENWYVQAYQTGLLLKEGEQYRVSLDLKSPDGCSVLLSAMINQPDWHNVGLRKFIEPGDRYETYDFVFTAKDVEKEKNRIGLVFGAKKGSVFVKNMTLKIDD